MAKIQQYIDEKRGWGPADADLSRVENGFVDEDENKVNRENQGQLRQERNEDLADKGEDIRKEVGDNEAGPNAAWRATKQEEPTLKRTAAEAKRQRIIDKE